MKKQKHYLCLISGQPMPNLLPLLDKSLCPSKEKVKVTLVVSQGMKKRAEYFELVIKNKYQQNITICPNIEIDNETLHSFKKLMDVFIQWLENSKEDDLYLNVTGGTKLMAIAAQEAFRMADLPVFYVEVETNKVIWIDQEKAEIQLDRSPDVKTVIEVNGFSILNSINVSDRELSSNQRKWNNFAQLIAEDIKRWAPLLRILNAIAAEAERDNERDANLYVKRYKIPANWDILIGELENAGLVCKGKGIYFFNVAARDFVKGGWLEWYVFDLLKKKFDFKKEQMQMNMEIESRSPLSSNRTKNELDIVLFTKQTLYIIECKARNMKRRENGDTIADAAMYKVAQLAKLQGLKSKGIVISPSKIRDEDKKRAVLYDVEVFDNLETLEADLTQLFNP